MARRRSPVRLHSSQSFGMFFDSASVSKQIENFVGDVKEKTLRPAAFAACTVLYDEIYMRAPEETGGLADALYRYRDITRTYTGKEVWVVGVNHTKAPHFHLVEYGYIQPYVTFMGDDGHVYTNKKRRLATPKFIPAKPFFRPGYDAKIQFALQVALETLKIKIKDLV